MIKGIILGTKLAASAVVGFGMGAVTQNIVKVVTPENTKQIAKLCIYLGSYITAGVVASNASDEFERKFDLGVRILEMVVNHEVQPEQQIVETKEEA